MGDLVALSFDLMTSHDVVQLVLLQEALRHVGSELAAHSPLADGPAVLHDTKTIKYRGFSKRKRPERLQLTA